MIVFCRPEYGSRRHPGHHVIAFLFQDFNQPEHCFFLFFRQIEHLRTVLLAQVGSLSVALGRIVNLNPSDGPSPLHT